MGVIDPVIGFSDGLVMVSLEETHTKSIRWEGDLLNTSLLVSRTQSS